MINQQRIDQICREMGNCERDYNTAKSRLESHRQQLADFVLANSALIGKGQAVDLSAYEEAIENAEWDMRGARLSFEQHKSQLVALVNAASIWE